MLNATTLRDAGVPFLVGFDSFGRTAREEVEAFRNLGLWTNSELLTIWSETTPRSIFPKRQIGRLLPGYEASLLVLECDPLAEFSCVDRIQLRMKQGFLVGAW